MTLTIQATKEWDRISSLKERSASVTEEQVDAYSTKYLHPGQKGRLRPIQVRGLMDLEETIGTDYGHVSAWGVGHGKFLMSVLAFTARPDTKRPLLFVPAKLKHQTEREIRKQGQVWKIRQDIKIMSWEILSRKSGFEEMVRYVPDGIVGDEIHALKNPNSSRFKKLWRYVKHMREAVEAQVWVAGLSGTMTNRSIKEMTHILKMCMLDHSPLPRTYRETENWALAVDEKIDDYQRPSPGVLYSWATEEEQSEGHIGARKAVRRRMANTPGYSATAAGSLGTSLNIFEWSYDHPAEVQEHYERLVRDWETPNGDEIEDPLSLWRHSREIMCGFYSRWDPPAPRDWLEARKTWQRYVRETIQAGNRARNPLDTPFEVANAVDRGELPDGVGALAGWRAVRDSFVPNPVPRWIHDGVVRAAEQWAIDNDGIVWCEFTAVGKQFKQIPYFGANDNRIADYKGPCAASRQAHFEGKNLQQWSRNLVLAPPSSGKIWEQMLGRTHRPGQDADEVEVYVHLGCRALFDSFEQARADCRYQEHILGSRQKLNDATYVDIPTLQEVSLRQGKLW